MPRGDKSAYTDRQKRQAMHIEESYENRGVAEPEAARRAWATVNRQDGGGRKRQAHKEKAGTARGHATGQNPSGRGATDGGEGDRKG